MLPVWLSFGRRRRGLRRHIDEGAATRDRVRRANHCWYLGHRLLQRACAGLVSLPIVFLAERGMVFAFVLVIAARRAFRPWQKPSSALLSAEWRTHRQHVEVGTFESLASALGLTRRCARSARASAALQLLGEPVRLLAFANGKPAKTTRRRACRSCARPAATLRSSPRGACRARSAIRCSCRASRPGRARRCVSALRALHNLRPRPVTTVQVQPQ